jgi:hypothetical protein
MATVTINQVPWQFSNISYQFALYEWNGPGQVKLLIDNLPLGAAVKEFNYSGKIEVEDMMGSAQQAQDTTDGVGAYSGDFTLEQYGADKLEEIIAGIAGHGWGTVRLNTSLIFSKPGVDTFTHTIYMARVIENNSPLKAGKDPLAVQYTLKPHRIYKRGKDAFGLPLT